MSAEELAGQTIIQLELYDYTGKRLKADSMNVTGIRPTVNQFQITTDNVVHPLGTAETVIRGGWVIQDNVMTVSFNNGQSGTIKTIANFQINSVKVGETEFTKVKFI